MGRRRPPLRWAVVSALALLLLRVVEHTARAMADTLDAHVTTTALPESHHR